MKPVIEMQSMSHQIGRRYLLHHIDWQVHEGEHWVVFGMNGSGKTTLLSIIAGFKQPTGGSLKIFGEDYTNDNIFDLRKRIGWLSSSFFDKYYSRESVLNIILSAKSGTFGIRWGINDNDIQQAKRLLKEFHVATKINHPFNLLSKGERQNVLLARALYNNPDILIMDEPSAGLDIYARAHLMETIKQLADNQKLTLIYVTHYTEEIIPVFNQGLFLKNGCVYKKGAIDNLIRDDIMSDFVDYPIKLEKTSADEYYTHLEVQSKIREVQGMKKYGIN